jgi:YggT family protein
VIITLLRYLLQLYILVLLAYSVLSWFRLSYDSPWRKVQVWLARVCDPVLNRVRRFLPTANIGGVGIDLSVLVVFVVIELVIALL